MIGIRPSTVVDARGETLRLVRPGAVGVAELRAVVADLVAPDPTPAEVER